MKFQMYKGEFEELLNNMLSEEPFKNHIFYVTDEKYDYTIPDYVSQDFGILIGETWTCLTCHSTKSPKILKYDSFIMSLGEILHKERKLRPISHDKNTHLGKCYVTTTYFMLKCYEKMS